jgi:hypothetical protein
MDAVEKRKKNPPFQKNFFNLKKISPPPPQLIGELFCGGKN